jgi:hypothetical protein
MSPRAEAPSEPEFAFAESDGPELRFMGRQLALINKELHQRSRRIIRLTCRWLEAYEFVKFLEEDDLIAGQPVRGQRELLMGMLATVHGQGVLLLAKIQNDDVPQLEATCCSYRDLAACVEELADLSRALRSDMTDAMAAEIEKHVFPSSGGQC